MKTIITILRAAIGWHFLYEGLIKLFADNWSAASYLNNTYGFLSGFYHWLAASPVRMEVVDFLNVWGLILIGLALFLGVCVRWVSIAGALLLTLYYFAYPPFGISLLGGDGTLFIISPLFIEAAILVFFFAFKTKGYELENLLPMLRKKKETAPVSSKPDIHSRREMLKDLATLPVLGLFGWGAYRSGKIYGTDALSGATIQLNRLALGELKGELPKGKLGKYEISRLVAGGNLIGGWVHGRDLLFPSQLSKSYNTEKKIFETLMLCEQTGINAINIAGQFSMDVLVKYKKMTGSKIIAIIQIGVQEKSEDVFESVKKAIDNGMDIIQVQGGTCDNFVKANKIEPLGNMIDMIRSQGVVAGLGAHEIDSFIICEENGIIPDYYMCTLHYDNYWSAHPRENRVKFQTLQPYSNDHNQYHNNIFCAFPELAVEFVNRTKVPVMGYKVLAAGSIHPKDGFKWAFDNGADFICVGMFDFQIVEDANICIDTLQNLQNRTRAWYA